MRSLHPHFVTLRHILRVILAGASFLVPFFAALRGARRTRVPNRHLEPTAETHVPVVKMFCVVLCSGGHSLCRRRGSSGRRGCCSICCPVFSLVPTWLPTSSSSACCSSSTSVLPASATSNGWDVCLCWLIYRSWLIRRGGRGGNRCVRRLGYGSWGSWLLHGRLLICRGIRRRPCRELLSLHLWA